MKKLENLGRSLSREEQKMITGGTVVCVTNNNSSCGGGISTYTCHGSPDDCQDVADAICEKSDCCDGTTCPGPQK